MRKIFLSLAALTIAVAANAFTLKFNNGDKTISITSAVDNPDVLGDGGSVAVTFDAAKKAIKLTFDNATLQSDVNGELFYFKYEDADYKDVYVTLKGKNYLTGTGRYTKPIRFDGPYSGGTTYAHLYFNSGSPDAELNISGQTMLIQMDYNAKMTFGSTFEIPIQLNITSTSENQKIFYGSCGKDDSVELQLFCNLNITTTGNNQIVGLDGGTGPGKLTLGSFCKIRTEGVSVGDNTFVKDEAPYKGNLVLVNACPIAVGKDRVYTDEEFKPAGLKSGKISFDKATTSLILDNVELSDYIVAMIPELTISLKGDNVMNNPGESTDSRISILANNLKITGEKSAKLTIDGNAKCGAMTLLSNAEIGDFGKLTIKNVTKGIFGASSTVLTLNKTPMDIKTTDGAILGFDNIVMAVSGMKWSPEATYNATAKELQDGDGNLLKEVALTSPTSINQVVNSNAVGSKFIRNGQLYILRDGKTFTVTGQEVK